MTATAKVGRAEKMLTRALRVEIVKPIGELTWKELGDQLHTLRSVMHLLLTGAFLAAIEQDRKNRRTGSKNPSYRIEKSAPADRCIPVNPIRDG